MAILNSFRIFVLASLLTAGYFVYFDGERFRAVRQASGLGALPDRCVAKGQIAFTYDDGPTDQGYTAAVANAFESKNYKATFHVIAEYITYTGYPALLKRQHEAGHIIGLRFKPGTSAGMTDNEFVEKLRSDSEIIKRVIGVYPKFLRLDANDLANDDRKIALATAMGFVLPYWNVDAFDDQKATVSTIIEKYNSTLNKDLFINKLQTSYIAVNRDLTVAAATAAPRLIELVEGYNLKPVPLTTCLGVPAYRDTNEIPSDLSERVKKSDAAQTSIQLAMVLLSIIAGIFFQL